MKIFKGPKTTNRWRETDTRSLTKWSEDWKPGKQLVFDGTIEKSGTRHTKVGIEFEAQDIESLHDAFQRFQKQQIQVLEKRERKLSASVDLLETAFQKLDSLLSEHKEKAPSETALIETAQAIAEHFRSSYNWEQSPDLHWIEWESL